ncbi:MAG: hypothetical protein ABSD58_03180 [Verrucomicrobiia bacterium]|jgi:hypothetical protein
MRTVPLAWTALETARERQVALLFHIWICRDAYSNGSTAGKVTPPVGWGSWTYSTGFQGNVNFTDVANYAQDWQSANSGNPITRTYAPAAIEFDASQVFRKEDTTLDPHDITLQVDPSLEPFADYVNRAWPLRFGITIYKVHRNGNAVATVDNGSGTQVPVVDVLFVGYLNADDTLELNSAGLELTIDPSTATGGARAKLTTQWDHVFKKLDRLVPRPVFSIQCPKMVYSTGFGAAVDCNADMPSNQVTGTVAQMNGMVISAIEWGALPNAFFAQGMIVYAAIDPVSGLEFTFTFDVVASAQRGSSPTYGDLQIMGVIGTPPLVTIGTIVQAYKGCNRNRNDGTTNSCMLGFIPAGTIAALPGTFSPGTLRVSLELFQTPSGGSNEQNPASCYVYITATELWIIYNRDNGNQIGNIAIGVANGGSGTPFDSASSPALAWTVKGSTIVSNQFPLANASASGPPAQTGYHISLTDSGATTQITQKPTAANGYTAIIKCPGGSPANFDFTLGWIANTGTPVTIGNLSNFGGADIPIEHPSLETANQ